MTKALLISVVCSILSYKAVSQFVYHGDKQYPSTNMWQFVPKEGGWERLSVSVAKGETVQYLFLAYKVAFTEIERIGGSVFIILQDGKTVTLTTKIATDAVDGESQVLYSISKQQIALLEASDIATIRFNIKSEVYGRAKSLTAHNYGESGYQTDYHRDSYNTAADIAALMN